MTKMRSDQFGEELPVWHLRVAYHGGNYCGWQVQVRDRTVQEELQKRLRKLFREDDLKIYATSRTDTGVHALDQNVSFTPSPAATLKKTPERLRFLLNRWLPSDIRVMSVDLKPSGFHARYSAAAKAYTYVLECGDCHSPFSAPFAWQIGTGLNPDRLREAAAALVGRHDFAGFSANPRRPLDSTVREIYRFEVIIRGARIYLSVAGSGFLYKMMRSLAGYLVEAARDEDWRPDEVGRILESGRRTARVKTAPPQGLFLARVFFDPGEWRNYQPLLPPFSV